MLYPKNKEPQLSEALFQNPGCEYRGTPFWAWNCQLQKDELLRQLEVMKKMGFGGAHMHVRTGMATPYLSDEHMELIKSCVEKCAQEDMLAWLYDEDRWPSGAAGGIVTKEERFRARYLLFTPEPYSDDFRERETYDSSARGERSQNGYLLACFDVQLDDGGCLASARRIGEEEPAQGTKWYAYVETPNPSPWYNGQTYVNTLDKAAMKRFIEVTYERYLETVGEDFGGRVPAIFTDEPQFPHKRTLNFADDKTDVVIPWTDDLPDTFSAAYGEDLVAGIPELFWELPQGVSTVRYHYHDHVCERFTQAFADQCGNWCQEHGLMLTGHMMEEPTLWSQTAALGEAMRSYRGFQLPGIDMLCNGVELTTAKQAQSAAHQFGREGVLSELYGVTSWAFDFRGHKFQGDWQAALGVTVRVPHLAWVSMKGEAKRDYPASINYQSPWWEHYSYIEDHFSRIHTAMTRGEPLVKVGVIHPVESYWLHFGPSEQTAGKRSQLDRDFQSLTDWLLNGGLDFDFISESLLPIQCEKGGAPLRVGKMAYDAILVPGCETLRASTLERLEAFREMGGKLIFLGEAPKYVEALESRRGEDLWSRSQRIPFEKNALLEALEEVRLVDLRAENGSRTDGLIHQLRRDGESRWLFIAHCRADYNPDIIPETKTRISLKGAWDVTRYDTLTGEICPLESTVRGGRTVLTYTLYDLDSLLLRFTPRKDLPVPTKEPEGPVIRRHSLPDLVDYTLSEPNCYVLDKAEFALDEGPWHASLELLQADNVLRGQLGWPSRQSSVAQPWTIQEEAAEHTARLRFRVECRREIPGVTIALEDADVAEVFLNGQAVTAPVEGWYTDKSIGKRLLGDLREGTNEIEVRLPFGKRTNIEWCYLLGDFGVRVAGTYRELTAREEKLGFSDITGQGLAHYTGNLTYTQTLVTEGGDLRISVPHYEGAAVKAEIGGRSGYIVLPPYRLTLKDIPAGQHELKLTLLGNRQNAFGPLHQANSQLKWIGPDAWRTLGSWWTESYRLTPVGILTPPIIEELE